MSQLSRITLRLARNPDAGFPDGDPHRGYTLVAPIGADGRLDVDLWRREREACRVVRFSPDPDDRADGWLTHRGTHWSFRYDEDEEGPDEPTYRLGDHVFKVDEYVTVHDHHGAALTYRISDVSPLSS